MFGLWRNRQRLVLLAKMGFQKDALTYFGRIANLLHNLVDFLDS